MPSDDAGAAGRAPTGPCGQTLPSDRALGRHLVRLHLLPAELRLERAALVGAQAAAPPGRGDLQPLHDLGRAGLADAREGLQDGRYPHLADDLVGLALLEDVG